jgi:hypothetical protein
VVGLRQDIIEAKGREEEVERQAHCGLIRVLTDQGSDRCGSFFGSLDAALWERNPRQKSRGESRHALHFVTDLQRLLLLLLLLLLCANKGSSTAASHCADLTPTAHGKPKHDRARARFSAPTFDSAWATG